MNRVNNILFHSTYQQHYGEIQSLEADRKFCGHTMEHFLAVARLSVIMAREEGLDIDKEVIYATALLHDIGRALEMTKGIPHHKGSVLIARDILDECGFDKEEEEMIVQAIEGHREMASKKRNKSPAAEGFTAVFRKADKLSRNCFDCLAIDECNWPVNKKNKGIAL